MGKIKDVLERFCNELFDVIRKVENEKEADKILKKKGITWKTKKSTSLFGGRVSYRNEFRRPVAVYHVEDKTLEITTVD